jgi:hypothetical protein
VSVTEAEMIDLVRARSAAGQNWLTYFFAPSPPRPFARQLMEALSDCDRVCPGIANQLLTEILGVRLLRRDPAAYEQFLQKLAEIVGLRAVLCLEWPDGTRFEHEPRAPNGRRPELLVETADELFLFEVKCPRLIARQLERGRQSGQVVARAFPGEGMRELAANLFGDDVLWPKDNNLKDFLVSAEEKFCSFDSHKPTYGVLIVVWDEHMYEAISPLTHPHCGLLTEGTWLRDEQDQPLRFESVNGVFVLDHFGVLTAASREEAPRHRAHPFKVVDENYRSNVWCPNDGCGEIPRFLLQGFDAFDQDAYRGVVADYDNLELIFWLSRDADPDE